MSAAMDETMRRPGLPPLLDEDVWDLPERLSRREGRAEAGADRGGRCDGRIDEEFEGGEE